jgi:hypothetical protein
MLAQWQNTNISHRRSRESGGILKYWSAGQDPKLYSHKVSSDGGIEKDDKEWHSKKASGSMHTRLEKHSNATILSESQFRNARSRMISTELGMQIDEKAEDAKPHSGITVSRLPHSKTTYFRLGQLQRQCSGSRSIEEGIQISVSFFLSSNSFDLRQDGRYTKPCAHNMFRGKPVFIQSTESASARSSAMASSMAFALPRNQHARRIRRPSFRLTIENPVEI